MLVGFVSSTSAASAAGEDGFRTTCLTESLLIRAYKAAIYDPHAKTDWERYAGDGLKQDSFRAEDGAVIRGLVWKAARPTPPTSLRGYLLVAQGTSMLAAEIYELFREFRDLGLDVYLYDYRGYGESGDAETTLAGIISDYAVRIRALNAIPEYKARYLFGISLGGIVFANAIGRAGGGLHREINGVVFDSVPHATPWYMFCPSRIDPVKLLPDSCRDWLVIGGDKDAVIGDRAAKLAKAAARCGAQSKIEKHFGHIFMDGHKNTTERMSAAKRHFERLLTTVQEAR